MNPPHPCLHGLQLEILAWSLMQKILKKWTNLLKKEKGLDVSKNIGGPNKV